eukprot:CAMPEP_0119510106 /NCGR_PEP_ID=MMETSP1344-20130328/29186_1 /TAXON_ID=236787 /ORGANISM="Florenciella parvula, Strain CCMP2471" /LENGTH=64 /DNA_ID=CAMNT_0007546999 /DNA_START=322 /DNA_END=516 /DNA_ORIENTATION=+
MPRTDGLGWLLGEHRFLDQLDRVLCVVGARMAHFLTEVHLAELPLADHGAWLVMFHQALLRDLS